MSWLVLVFGAWAADETISGKWKGEFTSPIGIQKYTFNFKVDGTNFTGTAIGERAELMKGTNEVVLTECRLTTNRIFFVESLKYGKNDMRVEYTGRLTAEGIRFHRKAGDVAVEDFVVTRVKDTGTNSLTTKP